MEHLLLMCSVVAVALIVGGLLQNRVGYILDVIFSRIAEVLLAAIC